MADKASFDRSVASSRTFQAHRAELDAIDADIARTRAAQSRLLTDNPATIRQELGLTDNSRTYARAQAERNVHQGTVLASVLWGLFVVFFCQLLFSGAQHEWRRPERSASAKDHSRIK